MVNVGLCFLTYASKPSVLSLELYHRIRCTVLNKEHLRVLLSWCGEESDVEFSWDGPLIEDEDEEAMDDSD